MVPSGGTSFGRPTAISGRIHPPKEKRLKSKLEGDQPSHIRTTDRLYRHTTLNLCQERDIFCAHLSPSHPSSGCVGATPCTFLLFFSFFCCSSSRTCMTPRSPAWGVSCQGSQLDFLFIRCSLSGTPELVSQYRRI